VVDCWANILVNYETVAYGQEGVADKCSSRGVERLKGDKQSGRREHDEVGVMEQDGARLFDMSWTQQRARIRVKNGWGC
jgi:hypothetical protein